MCVWCVVDMWSRRKVLWVFLEVFQNFLLMPNLTFSQLLSLYYLVRAHRRGERRCKVIRHNCTFKKKLDLTHSLQCDKHILFLMTAIYSKRSRPTFLKVPKKILEAVLKQRYIYNYKNKIQHDLKQFNKSQLNKRKCL